MATRVRGQTIVTTTGNRTSVQPAPQRSRALTSTPTVATMRNPQTAVRRLAEDARRLSRLEARVTSDIFSSGVLLRNLAVTASPTVNYVQHRLGRPFTGYWVTRIRTNVIAWVEAALPANMSSSTWLALTFSAPATIDLWVF